MILLFNSGYRGKYSDNALNALYLPHGANLQLRYSIGRNVDNDTADYLCDINRHTHKESVLILFIDRSTYAYTPLRFGHLLWARKTQNRLYITIELNDYAAELQQNEFKSTLENYIKGRFLSSPKRSAGEETSDGMYVILKSDDGTNLLEKDLTPFVARGDDGWYKAVNSLKATPAYQTDKKQQTVFLRARILTASGGNNESGLIGNHDLFSKHDLVMGRTYLLELEYIFPAQEHNPNACLELNLTALGALAASSNSKLKLNNFADTLYVHLETPKFGDEKAGVILVSTSNPEKKDSPTISRITSPLFLKRTSTSQQASVVRVANADIVVKVRKSLSFWAWTSLAIIAYVYGDASGNPAYAQAWYALPFWMASLIKAASLFAIFGLVGKKIL